MASPLSHEQLRERVNTLEWYHSIELAPGVVTPGWFDTRAAAKLLPWPDLTGKRCLDIGTFDGFWAFEMERRGAAEVLAIDLVDPTKFDWPRNSAPEAVSAIGQRKGEGSGFEIAAECLGSSVKRRVMSVYDLDPADVGTFDFIYLGSLLLHLRDPVGALGKVAAVCRGQLLLVDAIDLPLTLLTPHRPSATLDGNGRPWWWKPNVAGLVRMVESANFKPVGKPVRFFMPPGPDQPRSAVRLRSLRHPVGRDAAMRAWKGDPHAAVLADVKP